jgi:hypothetical protein
LEARHFGLLDRRRRPRVNLRPGGLSAKRQHDLPARLDNLQPRESHERARRLLAPICQHDLDGVADGGDPAGESSHRVHRHILSVDAGRGLSAEHVSQKRVLDLRPISEDLDAPIEFTAFGGVVVGDRSRFAIPANGQPVLGNALVVHEVLRSRFSPVSGKFQVGAG